MKKILLIIPVLLIGLQAQAQVTLDYYLPKGVTYDSSIPTPKSILGAEVGEWHIRHDQLVNYMYAVAEASDRVTITEYARTYENRPLLMLTITSPNNHRNIDKLKREHVMLTDASKSGDLDISKMPVVLTQSFSVHGNEPSGSNASPLTVYYLAAAQGREIDELLENAIILIDPSINPDGLSRFAQWANMHKSLNTLVSDPNSREFNEVWPGGRTNHYWFDLNRDWLLMQHPESKGRVAKFHEWKPNVLTDHHEMGTNSTFFFQPGIQSRTHPLTPARNQRLTASIAEYHAEELDKIQSLYYSEESFDDFYYGKGSTYPDVNGSIGILFEQASSRGHAQESIHGVLKFPFTVKNQFTATLSTMRAVIELREELLAHMRDFYKEKAEAAANASIKAYVFGDDEDRARNYHLAEMLTRNQIKVYDLKEDLTANGTEYKAGKAFVVPTNQQQYQLLTAMFERRTEFTDSLFYDVSAFNMPYAFNLPFAELNSRQFKTSLQGDLFSIGNMPKGMVVGGRSNYAYVFEWDEYYTPKAMYKLLANGVRAKVASQGVTAVTANGPRDFDYGTVMIPMGVQDDQEKVHKLVQEVAQENGITVYAISTGLTPKGMDLGSNNFRNLKLPKVAIIGGSGANSSEVGEAWHLLDQRYHMPLSIVQRDDIRGSTLDRYNVIITSAYSGLSNSATEELKRWVRNGGTLIAYKSAVYWAKSQGLANVEFVSREQEETEDVETLPYIRQSNDSGARVIGGAIFNTKIDLTHPLAYGFNDENFTVFRNSTLFMKKGKNPYSSPVVYTDEPLAAGYISDENQELLANTAAVVVSRFGSGKVIAMTDNPNFRAFWYGTNKLFANAIFFGHTISGGTTN
ncbi:M14 family metallopeptidase [Balneola vulgaris]|uniref:M14 family metallopeptidase n=1 Tax=Balneola vulgaris TaxID=287535 RepID=UPI000374E9FF|nr:M14 family metallopeptidase [Balneola vulgaris]